MHSCCSITDHDVARTIQIEDHINNKEEEVYQDLCSLQRLSHEQSTSAAASTTTVSMHQRDYVIRELLETEANYLDVLTALKKKFRMPLTQHLDRDIADALFPCLYEMHDIHTRFLAQLRESTVPDPPKKMSQVFLDFRRSFVIYGDYCCKLPHALNILSELCKSNEAVRKLVQQAEREYNTGKLMLRDILPVPMQRILKYALLLDKLVNETSPMFKDFRNIERAREAMIDIAQYINEVKRDSDHLEVLNKVRRSIVDINVLPELADLKGYGHLLLDGELHKKSHGDQKMKLRYAFVFDKILIMVKPLNTRSGCMQYSFKEFFGFNDYRIEMGAARRSLGRDNRIKYHLILYEKTNKTATTLYFKSEPERLKWFKAINEALDNLYPPGLRRTDHKINIHTFEQPQLCNHCSRFLKGRIHQGYLCSVCLIGLHKGCISSSLRCQGDPDPEPPAVCNRQLVYFNW